MVFHWNLSNWKSSQVSRTLLSILVDLNNDVVLMISTWSLIPESSSVFTNPLVTVLNAPITIGIFVTFMFHSFFFLVYKQSLGVNHSFYFLSILFCRLLWRQSPLFGRFSFLLLTITRPDRLAEIKWSVWISKSHRILCVPFSGKDFGFCKYHLFVWSNLNSLHDSKWITLPTKSFLVLYSFYANLLHSLIMWVIVSSLSSHNLRLIFCSVLSILALT